MLHRSADLTQVCEKFVQVLKEWHQETSIILDDYRPLKIIGHNASAEAEYFEPEKDLPQAQLLCLQIQKQAAILREDYAEAELLHRQEFDLMTKFWPASVPRLPRS